MRLIDADKFKAYMQDNYVLYDHTLADIDAQPTVEAIPIEWVLKWTNKNCMYCYDYDYPTEKTDGWFDINNMVKDWAKENGLS